MSEAKVKTKLAQIVLRIDDEHGHHIVRALGAGEYTIEGYPERPENYQAPPQYFLPMEGDDVKALFAEQGKEWRHG